MKPIHDNSATYNNVVLDEEYHPLILSMGQYRLFMKHGKAGREAMALLLHLMFTARLQHTNQVWAKDSYLKQGLDMGEKKVKAAKALLVKLGIIEYVRTRDDAGQLGEVYIRVRYMPSSEASQKAAEASGAETAPVDTTGAKTTRVDIHPSGKDEQMLEVRKGNASSNKPKGEPPVDGDTASPTDPLAERIASGFKRSAWNGSEAKQLAACRQAAEGVRTLATETGRDEEELADDLLAEFRGAVKEGRYPFRSALTPAAMVGEKEWPALVTRLGLDMAEDDELNIYRRDDSFKDYVKLEDGTYEYRGVI